MSDSKQASPHSDGLESQARSGSREPHENVPFEDEDIHTIHQQLDREKEEPTEGVSPVPMILLFLFCVLTFAMGIYMAEYSGGFRADVFDETADPDGEDAAAAEPKPWEEVWPELGARMYRSQCQNCHQGSGNGVPGAFPPLNNSRWVLGDPDRSIKILLRGLEGPIEVLGNQYNGQMPSYGRNGVLQFDNEQIAAVLSYVRTEWDNSDSVITPEMVAAARSEVADKEGTWTGDELLAEHPLE